MENKPANWSMRSSNVGPIRPGSSPYFHAGSVNPRNPGCYAPQAPNGDMDIIVQRHPPPYDRPEVIGQPQNGTTDSAVQQFLQRIAGFPVLPETAQPPPRSEYLTSSRGQILDRMMGGGASPSQPLTGRQHQQEGSPRSFQSRAPPSAHQPCPEVKTIGNDPNSSWRFSNKSNEPVFVKLIVNNIAAGSIIGKSGATIHSIRRQTGCAVKISPVREQISNAGMGRSQQQGSSIAYDRSISLSGTKHAVAEAIFCILAATKSAPSTMGAAKGEEGLLAPELRFAVPDWMVSVLIGKEGSHINALREKTGARIQISNREHGVKSGQGDRIIQVSGGWQQVQLAALLIIEIIQGEPGGSFRSQQRQSHYQSDVQWKPPAHQMMSTGGSPPPAVGPPMGPAGHYFDSPPRQVCPFNGRKMQLGGRGFHEGGAIIPPPSSLATEGLMSAAPQMSPPPDHRSLPYASFNMAVGAFPGMLDACYPAHPPAAADRPARPAMSFSKAEVLLAGAEQRMLAGSMNAAELALLSEMRQQQASSGLAMSSSGAGAQHP